MLLSATYTSHWAHSDIIILLYQVILQYPELKVLNLHGNSIAKMSEIDKLASLCNLRSLTIHGNPVEDTKGYRDYIISKIPQLEKLDFSKITKADRECAKTMSKLSGKSKKAVKAGEA
jgi:Leucine-rich repeat (LRR) protein